MLNRCAAPFAPNYEQLIDDRQKQMVMANIRFKDRHRGGRAFILGNGPSLNQQDLTPLKEEITFGTNTFWKHPQIGQWQPTYYCLVDPLYFDGSDAMCRHLTELSRHVYESEFFVPVTAITTIERNSLLPLDRLNPIRFHDDITVVGLKSVDLTGRIPG